MASKRKNRKRRRGTSLRLPSGEATTPIKMVWGSKPQAEGTKGKARGKGEAETAA
jgi:hypothetical protein